VIRPLQQERDALLGLLNRHIPPGPTYLELIEEVWNRGYEIFLVGGTVRDVMAGLKSQDVDMVTSIPLDRAIPLLASMYRHEPSVNKQ
jgi:tRNA nucleotidyltransferase/poly(A) polymerase